MQSAVEDVLLNDNSFYNDLEQLRLDIDAYVDHTSKRISSKRSGKPTISPRHPVYRNGTGNRVFKI